MVRPARWQNRRYTPPLFCPGMVATVHTDPENKARVTAPGMMWCPSPADRSADLLDHQLVFGRQKSPAQPVRALDSTPILLPLNRIHTSRRHRRGQATCQVSGSRNRGAYQLVTLEVCDEQNWPDTRRKNVRDRPATGQDFDQLPLGVRGEWVDLWGSRWGVMSWRYR